MASKATRKSRLFCSASATSSRRRASPTKSCQGKSAAAMVALADYAAATLIKEKTLLVVSSPADAHAEDLLD